MKSILCKTLTAFIIPAISAAAIWEAPNYWDNAWENKFSSWLRDEVTRDIFKGKKSKWDGTKTDCADAAYAMRIIFSYENGLPFKMKMPTGSRSEEGEAAKFLTNKTPAFDKYEAGVKRVMRFIDYIGDSVGTEHLAYHDTYSTTVDSIDAGHIYIFENSGGGSRHTHIVKDRLANGNLILLSSTVPKYARRLARIKGLPSAFNGVPWGFKRFKQPSFYDAGYIFTEETQKSNEQYALLKKFGTGGVMKEIKRRLQVEDEDLEALLVRKIENTCASLEDRVEVVKFTQEFLASKGRRCMNKAEYNNYSTPGRDKKIIENLEEIYETWIFALENSKFSNLPNDLVHGLNYLSGKKFGRNGKIVNLKKKDRNGLKELNKLCQVSFSYKGSTYKLNLKDFQARYNKKLFFGGRGLSPHPNDPVLLRWGIKSKKSKCKKF